MPASEGNPPPVVSSAPRRLAWIDPIFSRPTTDVRRIDTMLVLALAAWLIVNSHLESFYPYRWLAADGLLGNSMFYMISGYGIQASFRARDQAFLSYAKRRLLRIYPSVILALGFFLLIGVERPEAGLLGYLRLFIWPSPYTYVRLIVPFYLVLWGVGRQPAGWLYGTIAVALGIYAWVYMVDLPELLRAPFLALGARPELSWTCYFWILTAAGAAIARHDPRGRFSLLRLVCLGVIIVGYLGLKYMMVVRGVWVPAYPVLELSVAFACWLALVSLTDPDVMRLIERIPALPWALAFSANLTLEIYVFHDPLTRVSALSGLPFPLNIAALVGLTVVGAGGVFTCARAIRASIDKA